MRRELFSLAAILLWTSCCIAAVPAQPASFEGAKWIWFSPSLGAGSQSIPASIRYFRTGITLPDNVKTESAELIITADNLYTAYLNGKAVGESASDPNAWNRPKRFTVTRQIVPGHNVVAVEAANTAPGPAGLLVKLVVQLSDGNQIVRVSDSTWKGNSREEPSWQQPKFDATQWQNAQVVADFGAGPWGQLAVPAAREREQTGVGKVRQAAKRMVERAVQQQPLVPTVASTSPGDFSWPEAIVFLGDDCSLYRPATSAGTSLDSLSVTIFNARKSRAFPEHDLPAPMKVGRKLFVIRPARTGVAPRLLLDAGQGAIGSPSVSFDGTSIFVSMVRAGDSFFHIYRLSASGGEPLQLTDGPFHDIDPAEMPDGRIVFTSTRIGTFEEYHSTPSRSLFVMDADGGAVRPLTHTIIFDNEPEILADGRILFIRSDNFFDRGKVETLLHAIRPDGTEGHTEFGLEHGPEYGGRLRAHYCGSPAPMPDGRLAFLTDQGIAIGRIGDSRGNLQHLRVAAGDVAALPDGRLLCTLASKDSNYETIAILDTRSQGPTLTILYESTDGPLHSPVYLGRRSRPPVLPDRVEQFGDENARSTGFLFCQNARSTQNTTAGWSHVRAIRVLAAKGLTTRSSHSYIVHAGSEVTELGTVPLAPDGSFWIEVPADTPLALQAVDAEGRSELNEMSWIYVRPGERRGCAGCHQKRHVAPSSSAAMALRLAPLKLLGQGRPHRFRGNNAAVTGLMELQFDRYREVAGINRHADTADPLSTGAHEAADLVALLRGDDDKLAISAAQRLSIFRARSAAPALAACLRRPNRELRVAAAMALATCGSRETVPPLLETLTDQDPLVAQAAAVALENLTGHAESSNAYSTTTQGVPHDWKKRHHDRALRRARKPRNKEIKRNEQAEAWQRWFANTDWNKIEHDLVERLASQDRDVVRRAAVALGHTGGDAARAALRQYVTRERNNNPYPEWTKGHRGDGARFNSLSEANPRTLQAATRSLGYLKDTKSVAMLAETLGRHRHPETANLFLAEAAVEALGQIGTAEAEAALIAAFAALEEYPKYTRWYGDHDALMACHASPIHYFIIEALDATGSKQAHTIVPHLIRSVPIDPDRALLLGNDDYETLVGRVIRRSGAEANVVETCLAILGDPQAERTEAIESALSTIHRCWAGDPTPENRAAQIVSMVCRDATYEPRIRAAFDRYRMKPTDIPRVFDEGIPVVKTLPLKHWVCFYLARTLGNLADPRSANPLIAVLTREPAEAATGRPDPLGPGVMFLHNDLTPCWRAAVAWALGRIGDRRAVPVLLKVVGDLDNATDTRHAAAEALGRIADPKSFQAIRNLAEDYPEVSTRRVLLRIGNQPDRKETTKRTVTGHEAPR